ncbi:MAG: sporulation protein [Geodermatophilaceae bacterium]|nr:sporulation protein [Geodermatophilaceae bacterium]MDQ3456920.1 sporulation protein [Actinomycetota bacterium]
MDIQQLLGRVTDSVTVKRVFGEPIERDGALLVPVARVRGVVGGGGDGEPDAEGSGGGLGFTARPVGAYSVRAGAVSWHPALDLNRVILGGQLVVVALLLTVRSILQRRRTG